MAVEDQIEHPCGSSTLWSSVEIDSSVRVLGKSIVSIWPDEKGLGVIRACHPIPNNDMGYYFEITILNRPEDPCHIDMGITSQQLPFQEITTRAKIDDSGFRNIPNSFGYSSTGGIYWPDGEKYSKMQRYKGGDTVGCYFETKRKVCSFFLNGILQNKILQVKNPNEEFIPSLVFYNTDITVDASLVQRNWNLEVEGVI